MFISVGIDPDLHLYTQAILRVDNGKFHLEVDAVKAKGEKTERAVKLLLADAASIASSARTTRADFISIESQTVVYTGKTNGARPQDLIYLAQVAGGICALTGGDLIPPYVWKKQVPKKICQARVYSALGIPYEVKGGKDPYCVPKDWKRYDVRGAMTMCDWKDASDSVALAYWRLKSEGVVK